MVSLTLKKILRKPEIITLLRQFEQECNLVIAIFDPQGHCLWGQDQPSFEYFFTIGTSDHCLGQLKGDRPGELIANFFNYVCQQELAKKNLAIETLRKYEEVHFLSDFSVKISTCTSLGEMASIIFQEIHQLLQATEIFILLDNPISQRLEVIIDLPTEGRENIYGLQKILHRIFADNQAEIVNDVIKDKDYQAGYSQIRSLIAAPLTIHNKTIGILCIAHIELMQYSSEDLNLFITLASQVAAAIQTAKYYEKLKDYSQTLEHRVAERTQELQLAKQQLEKANQELEKLAIYDELTKIPNRRYFNRHIQLEWRRCLRDQHMLALILCDVDHFKDYNDYYGHQAGDACLQKVAEVITSSLHRASDIVARYGGEEFVIILSNTDADGANYLAQRIQRNLETKKIPHLHSDTSPFLTLSMGIACLIPSLDSCQENLIQLADKALYEAKDFGRNQICTKILSLI